MDCIDLEEGLMGTILSRFRPLSLTSLSKALFCGWLNPGRSGNVGLVEVFVRRSVQRKALLEMDDIQLLDIGISRKAAAQEAAKPFWRA
jgi:uncharacterized protein YjiS (DUF1127 family)